MVNRVLGWSWAGKDSLGVSLRASPLLRTESCLPTCQAGIFLASCLPLFTANGSSPVPFPSPCQADHPEFCVLRVSGRWGNGEGGYAVSRTQQGFSMENTIFKFIRAATVGIFTDGSAPRLGILFGPTPFLGDHTLSLCTVPFHPFVPLYQGESWPG